MHRYSVCAGTPRGTARATRAVATASRTFATTGLGSSVSPADRAARSAAALVSPETISAGTAKPKFVAQRANGDDAARPVAQPQVRDDQVGIARRLAQEHRASERASRPPTTCGAPDRKQLGHGIDRRGVVIHHGTSVPSSETRPMRAAPGTAPSNACTASVALGTSMRNLEPVAQARDERDVMAEQLAPAGARWQAPGPCRGGATEVPPPRRTW